jgi:hypothetical protein
MKRFFNIAGPCYPEKHYMLPAQERCQGILELIQREQYFVIHAARQSGKTTLLLDLAKQLNNAGQYYALYCSLESVDKITEPEKGIPSILNVLKTQIQFNPIFKTYPFPEQVNYTEFNTVMRASLSHFCIALEKPLILFFDEIDCLSNGTLITFLRQLRDGYINRSQIPFVHSIALVGMRNIRDYKGKIREDRETLGSASPFNIVSEVLTLRNFTQEEITRLYEQHTEQTGQQFSTEVVTKVYAYTCGQPWLVNAIAKEIVMKILVSDFSRPIQPEYVEQAVHAIILRRDTHIDSLMERLKEERVRRIVEPVILGESRRYDMLDDDYQYVLDLGLLSESGPKLAPANPIYAEVIIRTLNFRSQLELEDLKEFPEPAAYIVNNELDMPRLLQDFQQFWREHSDIWIEKYQYKEAAPHLILQAFLQRVVNSGGQVSREMAASTQRLDLCVFFHGRKYLIELKLRYGQKAYAEGINQLAGYLDKIGCTEGWLIVFDQRKRMSWNKRIFWKTKIFDGKTIHIIGC